MIKLYYRKYQLKNKSEIIDPGHDLIKIREERYNKLRWINLKP